jgi:hypothetical protein
MCTKSLIFSRYAVHDEYGGCTCVGNRLCWFYQHSSSMMGGGAVLGENCDVVVICWVGFGGYK